MSYSEQFFCDVCGKIKQQVNHWWIVYTGSDSFELAGWDAETAKESGIEALCGQECAAKALSQWMQSQSSPPSAQEARPEPDPAGGWVR